jgi:DNA-binding MarR family transcriptional regulator
VNAAGEVEHSSTAEVLQQLLGEVNALAIRLRHPASLRGQADVLPAAVRAVLQILQRDGPLSVPSIARSKSTSRQNVQIIVNRLKAIGVVELSPNPAHKRSELVSITEAGASVLTKAEGLHASTVERLAAELSKAELVSCLESIQKLRGALNGEQPRLRASRKRPGHLPTPEPEISGPANWGSDEMPVNLL